MSEGWLPNGPLKVRLIENKPRETSGARSSNRIDFQKSWALCHLIELHRSGKDYVLVFDYHDDILVLNSVNDPTQIDFYQIKTRTKSGNWTATNLTEREKGQTGVLLNSPLGKLVQNKLTFPEDTRSLNFISNQAFRLAVKGRAASITEKVCISQLDDKELRKILDALRTEHGLSQDPDCCDCTHLEVTALSVKGHDDHAMGVLGRYLEELYPGEKIPLAVVYRSLADEIKRKTNVETHPGSFEKLCAERCISRDAFNSVLEDIRPESQFSRFLAEAVTQLQRDGMGFDEIRSLRSACETYEVERMNLADSVLRRARQMITNAVQTRRAEGPLPGSLRDAVREIEQRVQNNTKLLVRLKSETYRAAMIVMALYDL